MKQRVITGAVIAAVVAFVFYFMYTPVFTLFCVFLSAAAVYEINRAVKVKNSIAVFLSVAVAALTPIYVEMGFQKVIKPSALIGVYILAMLFLMLLKYDITRFEHIAIAVFSSLCIPLSFSVFLFLRDIYLIFPNKYSKAYGVYCIVFVFICSWCTDTFAYFVGRKFGKHKMSPVISPKKTVEGAAGGVVITALVNLIVLFVVSERFFAAENVSYLKTLLLSVILSLISMLGDLSASVIKRNYGEKDFGTLMPGHGGIMDRFDSCLFVLPSLYIIINFAS